VQGLLLGQDALGNIELAEQFGRLEAFWMKSSPPAS
jgi:hypothetical protein